MKPPPLQLQQLKLMLMLKPLLPLKPPQIKLMQKPPRPPPHLLKLKQLLLLRKLPVNKAAADAAIAKSADAKAAADA